MFHVLWLLVFSTWFNWLIQISLMKTYILISHFSNFVGFYNIVVSHLMRSWILFILKWCTSLLNLASRLSNEHTVEIGYFGALLNGLSLDIQWFITTFVLSSISRWSIAWIFISCSFLYHGKFIITWRKALSCLQQSPSLIKPL